MRWSIVIPIAYLLLGLEAGLRETLAYGDGGASGGVVSPSFVIPLVVYVALWAKPVPSFWLGVVLGLMVDLLTPVPLGFSVGLSGGVGDAASDGANAIDIGNAILGGVGTSVGPHALGFALMTQFVQTVRGMVIRRNPVAVIVIVLLGAMVSATVESAAWLLQGLTDDSVSVSAAAMLRDGLLSAVYTGVVGVVLCPLLMLLTPVLGFPTGPRAGRT